MFDRLRALFGRPRPAEDVTPDAHTARTRETGGAERDDIDSAATTGTGHTGDYVGRIAGQDDGLTGETGAETRMQR